MPIRLSVHTQPSATTPHTDDMADRHSATSFQVIIENLSLSVLSQSKYCQCGPRIHTKWKWKWKYLGVCSESASDLASVFARFWQVRV